MTCKIYDVAIVGAGPAGMAAATEAARLGLSAIVLDEQSQPGGQVYNSLERSPLRHTQPSTFDYADADRLAGTLAACGAEYVRGAGVWLTERAGGVWQTAYSSSGRSAKIQSRTLLLATGAYERPMPVPGWDLTNVMTAGAAQLLLKSSGVAKRGAIFAGSGPLLYRSAIQYMRLGVPVRAVLDTSGYRDYLRAVRHLKGALQRPGMLFEGLRMLAGIRNSPCRYVSGVHSFRAEGRDTLEAVAFEVRGRCERLDGAAALFLHHGVIPNIQLALAAGCKPRWDETLLAWCVACDDRGRTSRPGLLVTGDAAGILGAKAAPLQARLSVRAIAEDLDRADPARVRADSRSLESRLRKEAGFRRFLNELYRPPQWLRLPQDDTLVCRCEEVTAGTIRSYVRTRLGDPNQLKSLLRCGMGPCQGRQCSGIISEIAAEERGTEPSDVGRFRPRPPVKPVSLGELAMLTASERIERGA